MTDNTPAAGDTLVISRADGTANVRKRCDDGTWEYVRDGISDVKTAREIARAQLELEPHGRLVWYKEHSEPDSAIRRF